MAYAEHTTVPVHKTRSEIERLLAKHKALQWLTAHDYEGGSAVVQFKLQNRMVRFRVKLITPEQLGKLRTRAGYSLSEKQRADYQEQDERQRWRALLLVIKAKLECIESGIATFEEEFLAHIVLPNDQTVGEVIVPRIAHVYEHGGLLLPEHASVAE